MKTEDAASTLAREVNPRVRGLFLKNLGDFQTELARIQGGFVPALSLWRHRKEFPAFPFRLLRRVQDLRIRGRELGISFQEMHLSATVAGRNVLDVLCDAKTPADYYKASLIVTGVLAAAIKEYQQDNDTVYDQPTIPILEANLTELESQAKWTEVALAEMAKELKQLPESDYLARVEAANATLGKALKEHNVRGTAVTAARRAGSLPVDRAVLPVGFRHLEFGPEPMPKENTYQHRERYHAINFLQEVQAADSCASMLFEAPDMPWDFYLDLSRHAWDEARHAMFGETKLEALGSTAAKEGLSMKAYTMRQTLKPVDRYAALSTQEADAFPGKHRGLKDSLAHGDSVSAMAWSYDIADETQHVRFGSKWIPVMIEKTNEARSFEQVKTDAENWRVSVLAEVYKPAAAARR